MGLKHRVEAAWVVYRQAARPTGSSSKSPYAGGPIADLFAVARGGLFLGLLTARHVAPGAAAWQSQNDRCFSLLLS
jgi:hypothetical protein